MELYNSDLPALVGYLKTIATEKSKAKKSKTKPEPMKPEPAKSSEPKAVQTLRDILAGKYDNDPFVMTLIEAAYEELEQAGLVEQYEEILSEVDAYTDAIAEKIAA